MGGTTKTDEQGGGESSIEVALQELKGFQSYVKDVVDYGKQSYHDDRAAVFADTKNYAKGKWLNPSTSTGTS